MEEWQIKVVSTLRLALSFQVQHAIQQAGFHRTKRGYNRLRLAVLEQIQQQYQNEPTDPYFPFQWYLVST